jgi:hypothetical protein
MVLAAGARLGHSEIVSALGAGGMGEAYRARDARPDRIVAIKVIRGREAGLLGDALLLVKNAGRDVAHPFRDCHGDWPWLTSSVQSACKRPSIGIVHAP